MGNEAVWSAALPAPSREQAAATAPRALHVVQVSLDAAVFDAGDCEPRARQVAHARELRRRAPGSRLTLLVLGGAPGHPSLQVDGTHFIPLGGRWRGLVRLLPALVRLHRERRIDVIATQRVYREAWLALAFARVARCRIVGQVHSDLVPLERRPLARRWLRQFDALRVVATSVKARIDAAGWHHDVRVVPVAVDAAPPTGDEPRRREVLFVGRLAAEKALDTWLAVAARVADARPDVRFTVAGAGALRSAHEARATALGIAHRVTFLGHVPNAELAALYGRAAVLLLTSRSEGFGRVLVEAASAGTPAVATRIGGVADVVEHEVTGFLHEPDDVEGLAASVVALLDDPARRRDLGAAAARRVQARFDPAQLRREWIDLLAGDPPAAAGDLLPRRRTLRRWLAFARTRTSTLRWLEYDRLTGLRLDGRVLDLGGGRRNGYAHLLDVRGRIDSVNVDQRVEPTIRADLDRALPFRAGSFDHLISLNTLEHVACDERAVAEGLRVLRPGGSFHLIVPFLYRVHASPSDFHRHTAAWWRTTLVRHGARADALAIEPLVWDRAVSAHSFFGTSRINRALRALLAARAVVADLGRRGERLPESHRGLGEYALGYYIHGTT